MAFRLPGPTNRTLITGSTGAGKTYVAVWLTSTRQTLDWTRQPVIILDWKREKLINSLGAKKVRLDKRPPEKPGLYIAHCDPAPQALEDLEGFLTEIWRQENTGLFFDETKDYRNTVAVKRLFTQGRSKNIPCIICAQKPTGIPTVMRSEAEYYVLMRLNDLEDRKEMRRYMGSIDVTEKPDKHCSIWYDTTEDEMLRMGPVPSRAELVARFRWAERPARARRVI